MKFKALSLILALAFTLTADARERIYVPGDGGMDYNCSTQAIPGGPFFQFHFQLFWDSNTGKSGFEIISDENLKSGNGDLIYKIDVTQNGPVHPGMEQTRTTIPGCEEAIIIMEQKSETRFETYFECAADGDAGFGTIVFDTTAFVISGTITFPEGQSTLPMPIPEDTTYQLTCE